MENIMRPEELAERIARGEKWQVVPEQDREPTDSTKMECMGRHKHCWQWVWEGTRWTNRVRCTTCGLERVNDGAQA